jgi:hypothetical protein
MLEPSASYWGRWGESGAGYLPEERFPALRDDCLSCAQKGGCSDECSRYYVVKALTSEETPWLGKLRWYEFRHEEHEVNVEEGPSLLASQGVMDNRLPAVPPSGSSVEPSPPTMTKNGSRSAPITSASPDTAISRWCATS